MIRSIKLLFGIIGTLIGGAVIAAGPGTLPEEIPFHRELGFGVIALGALMTLALFSVRVKALLTTLFIAGLTAAALSLAYIDGLQSAQGWFFAAVGALGVLGTFGTLTAVFTGKDEAQ